MKQSVYLNIGKNSEYAFVFSVPGRIEEYNNRPVAGNTGIYLEELILLLKDELFQDIDIESKVNRYNYRITNSYTQPIYGKRTEATDKEVKSSENILRLQEELEHISRYIFLFGKKAQIAFTEVNKRKPLRGKPIRLIHLSSLNREVRLSETEKNNLESNTTLRLQKIKEEILKQIQSYIC